MTRTLALPPTETLTFLFTDVEGSTSLLEGIGHEAYQRVLADHHAIIRRQLAAHDGREIDPQGDSFFAVFTSASACAAAMIEMQWELAAHDWREARRVRVRMGVHSGEASEASTGLVGFDVHRAARVQTWRVDRWAPACRAAGLAAVPRPYDLRHSFASLLLAEGRQPLYVARQLGHSLAVLLSTYAHLIDEYVDAERIDADTEIANARQQLVRQEYAN